MNIVADTSSLNYAVLIGEAKTLRKLYGSITIPEAVAGELRSLRAPRAVRQWIRNPPEWLDVRSVAGPADPALGRLGPGERHAIILAEEMAATLLMDEKDGRREARRRRLPLTGLLGALRDAGQPGLTDFPAAVARLQQTTFRISPNLVRKLLETPTPEG